MTDDTGSPSGRADGDDGLDDGLGAVIEKLVGEMGRIARSETIIGDPIEVGHLTLVPINKVGLGFGTGLADAGPKASKGKRAKVNAGGAGGGLSLEPQGILVVDNQNGTKEFIPVGQGERGAFARVLDLVPAAIDKLAADKTGHGKGHGCGCKGKKHKSTNDDDKAAGDLGDE